MLKNIFGDISLDSTVKQLVNVISRFSFDSTSQLRVSLPTNQNINSVSTISTVSSVTDISAAKISVGDTTKNSTIQASSASLFCCTVGRNFNRSSNIEW